MLQQLRRLEPSELEPWLRALEAGSLASETDLLAVLADRLEGADAARLLVCWLNDHGPGGSRFGAPGEAEQLALIGRRRHPACARALRQAVEELERADLPLSAALLPPLGLQRDGDDFPLLARLAGDPGSRALRRGALEGLAVGLSAWPLAPCVSSWSGWPRISTASWPPRPWICWPVFPLAAPAWRVWPAAPWIPPWALACTGVWRQRRPAPCCWWCTGARKG